MTVMVVKSTIGFMGFPPKWNLLSVLGVTCLLVLSVKQITCENGRGENKTEKVLVPAVGSGDIVPIGLFSVDADHKTKLESIYDQTIQKFLKRRPQRKGRQDDGDDGDEDEDGGGGGAGGAGAVGNPGLAAISMIPALIPQIVSSLTQFGGVVNQALNGTDTPNIPSFLIRHGPEAINFFQSLASSGQMAVGGGAGPLAAIAGPSRLPGSYLAQRFTGAIPGPLAKPHAGPPLVKPDPIPGQEPVGFPGSLASLSTLPDLKPEDYVEEDVKQPLQPTLAPIIQTSTERERFGSFSNILKDPNRFQTSTLRTTTSQPEEPKEDTTPHGTSLGSIYRRFKARPQDFARNETEMQPGLEGFSNELLHGITNAIFNRQQADHQALLTNTPAPARFHQEYYKPQPQLVKEAYPNPSSETLFKQDPATSPPPEMPKQPVYSKPTAEPFRPNYPAPSFQINNNKPFYPNPPPKIISQIYLQPPTQQEIVRQRPFYPPPTQNNYNHVAVTSTSAPIVRIPVTSPPIVRIPVTSPPIIRIPFTSAPYAEPVYIFKGIPTPTSTAFPVTQKTATVEKLPIYPDISPSKPIYWMNMYYPGGLPVLIRVTEPSVSQFQPTTPKRRRRRTRSTTTTPAPEADYYEDDDAVGKGSKKRRGSNIATTTEADF